jgi:hypothetical protein
MKSFFSFLAVAILLLVGATSASAQNGAFAPYVDAGVSVSSTFTGQGSLTARNPNYNFGAGIESSTSRLLLDINGQFNTQNVRGFDAPTIDSYKGTISGSGYLKVSHLLLGGGVRWSDQILNFNSASLAALARPNVNELVPFVGGGVQFSRDRFLVSYVLPGRATTTNQYEADFHNEVFLFKNGHIRLTQDVVGSSGITGTTVAGIRASTRLAGGSAGAGLKFVF